MTAMRSAKRAASARSCTTASTAPPARAASRSRPITTSWWRGSSETMGSSASSTGASVAIARARATRARSPPDSVVTCRAARPAMPVLSARHESRRGLAPCLRERIAMRHAAERHHMGDRQRPVKDVALRQIGDGGGRVRPAGASRAAGRQVRSCRRRARGRRGRARAWSCPRRWDRPARRTRRRRSARLHARTIARPPMAHGDIRSA